MLRFLLLEGNILLPEASVLHCRPWYCDDPRIKSLNPEIDFDFLRSSIDFASSISLIRRCCCGRTWTGRYSSLEICVPTTQWRRRRKLWELMITSVASARADHHSLSVILIHWDSSCAVGDFLINLGCGVVMNAAKLGYGFFAHRVFGHTVMSGSSVTAKVLLLWLKLERWWPLQKDSDFIDWSAWGASLKKLGNTDDSPGTCSEWVWLMLPGSWKSWATWSELTTSFSSCISCMARTWDSLQSKCNCVMRNFVSGSSDSATLSDVVMSALISSRNLAPDILALKRETVKLVLSTTRRTFCESDVTVWHIMSSSISFRCLLTTLTKQSASMDPFSMMTFGSVSCASF